VRCPARVVGALVLCTTIQAAQSFPWKIDQSTAARLAAEGIAHSTQVNNLVYVGDVDSPFVEFYGLTEVASFGYFAVNPWTGDVWALWGCRRLSTPALRRSQAAIRRRFTPVELKQYPRLHRLKPECIVED